MVQGDVEWSAAILGVNTESHGLANLELGAKEVDGVLRVDLVIIGRVSESERKHTLLLQVGFVL